MTFVYPLLLGGLVFAGIPVLLHFLVRQKPKTLVFPAYRFLLQKKKSNTRNLRLRHLLLLLLRIGLIVLLCLALSRPRVQHETFGLINPEKPVAMVMIFDTTPSMAYPVGEQTRLDLAKERALDLLDKLPDDCRVLVLDAADKDSFAREVWHKSLEAARIRIKSLTLRPTSAPVNDAIAEAYRRFETWDDFEGLQLPRFVCVFSDRTKASWDSSAAKRPEDVQAIYFDVGIDEPVDAAITQATISGGQESFLAGDLIPLNVVVKATGAKLDTTLVVAEIAEHKIKNSQHITSLEPGKSQALTLALDSNGLAPRLHQAVVKLQNDPDAWLGNNQRFVTFRILEKPRVLVLSTDPRLSQRLCVDLEFWRYAAEQATISALPDLRKYDAIFLANVAAPPENLWLELASYVQGGGNLCIIPSGEDMVLAAYKSEAALKVMPAKVLKDFETTKGVAWSYTDLESLQHPFMMYYRNWLDFDVVQHPAITYRYWQLEKDAVAIAWYDDANHHPALVERIGGKKSGRVIFLTTPLDSRQPVWNNFLEKLKDNQYLALVKSCARYLCVPPEDVTHNFQFGISEPTYTHKGPAFPKFELESGDSNEDVSFDNGVWTGTRLPKPSNYTLVGVDGAARMPLYRFSINIAPEESDLSRVPAADIDAVLGKDAVTPQDRRRSLADSMDWQQPLELFPWLMIGLLFLLAFENLLANRFYRPIAT